MLEDTVTLSLDSIERQQYSKWQLENIRQKKKIQMQISRILGLENAEVTPREPVLEDPAEEDHLDTKERPVVPKLDLSGKRVRNKSPKIVDQFKEEF